MTNARSIGSSGGRLLENLSTSTRSLDSLFHDSDIKELSYDLGVDPRILKFRVQETTGSRSDSLKKKPKKVKN